MPKRNITLKLKDGSKVNLTTDNDQQYTNLLEQINNEKFITINKSNGSQSMIKCHNIDEIDTQIVKPPHYKRIIKAGGIYYWDINEKLTRIWDDELNELKKSGRIK